MFCFCMVYPAWRSQGVFRHMRSFDFILSSCVVLWMKPRLYKQLVIIWLLICMGLYCAFVKTSLGFRDRG